MKLYIRYSIYVLVIILSKIFVVFYRIKNFRKKKLFIYTDSRGFEITKIFNRKNPFSSFVNHFVRNFNSDVYICPEKHTTFFDFYDVYRKKRKRYDFVILNLGVVDFSPRPISQIEDILKLKKERIVNLFNEELFHKLKDFKGYDTEYFNEKTSAIIPEDFIKFVAVKLNEIENLIWITCNPVDVNWRGNYKKDRPSNINMVNTKSKELLKYLKTDLIIDFTNLTMDDVHKYTCDNIHYSEMGMKLIEEKLKTLIQ